MLATCGTRGWSADMAPQSGHGSGRQLGARHESTQFLVSASHHTQSVRSHTHFFSHPCIHQGTSQRNHFRQNNMEDNMCAWCATCASHSTHELVGEQTLNFFLCIVILTFFLNKTKYDSKISETLTVNVGPAIGNLFSQFISG